MSMDMVTTQGFNLLTLACYLRRWTIVEFLVSKFKNDLDHEDPEGFTPLGRIVLEHEFDIAQKMIDHGCDVNYRSIALGLAAIDVCQTDAIRCG